MENFDVLTKSNNIKFFSLPDSSGIWAFNRVNPLWGRLMLSVKSGIFTSQEKWNIHLSRKSEYSPLKKSWIFTFQEKLNIHLLRKAEYSPLKKSWIFTSQEKRNTHLSRKVEYSPLGGKKWIGSFKDYQVNQGKIHNFQYQGSFCCIVMGFESN